MSLFVTGTESFVGRVLVEACGIQGIDVNGIDSVAPGTPWSTRADIRDPAIADLIPQGATVVHLAAISRDADCGADPQMAFDVNVNGTLNVAKAAQKRGAVQLIFASSEWVYGDVHNDEMQVEDQAIDITAMKSVYATTKIIGEQCLRLACPLPAVTVLRFGIIYGGRASNWSAVESLFNTVRTETDIRIGSARTARRFIHIEDIVSGIVAARGRSGFEVFNLSGDVPVTLGEVVETSAKLWNRSVTVVETNPGQPSVRNPDNAKARAELAWAPVFDLEKGLASLKRFFEPV